MSLERQNSHYLQTRGKLAVIDLERYSEVITKRLGNNSSGSEGVNIVNKYASVAEFVLNELNLYVPLTDPSLLSYKEKLEVGMHWGTTDHHLPHHGFDIWYFPGFGQLQPPRLLTRWKSERLREGKDRALCELENQTPTQIAQRFTTVIETAIKEL